ncbi:MAG: hypothetical protein E7238_09450 [Sarcina sp.]|nr:hypothetical protein [Sarcina sp.]
MIIIYASVKIESQCTILKEALKLFGGNRVLAVSLLARVNALYAAECIRDIIVQPAFHFHNLGIKDGRNLTGLFAIDVKTRKAPWRLILQPLDEKEMPFVPCHIDEISATVKIIKIMEVSRHYE